MKNIKNIVWILTDSQHSEAVGYMGNKAVHTPNLDTLAAKSQIFTNAHCQSTICVPSRESFITGRYPSGLGILHNKHDHASTAETLGTSFSKPDLKPASQVNRISLPTTCHLRTTIWNADLSATPTGMITCTICETEASSVKSTKTK